MCIYRDTKLWKCFQRSEGNCWLINSGWERGYWCARLAIQNASLAPDFEQSRYVCICTMHDHNNNLGLIWTNFSSAIISLGPGAPRSEYYPFDNISFKVPSIGNFTEVEAKGSGIRLQAGKYDRREGTSIYGGFTLAWCSKGEIDTDVIKICPLL